MRVLPLSSRLINYLKKRGLEKQFGKQKRLFEQNPLYPSLNTEVLEPKHLRIYSFRITLKYLAIFIYVGDGVVEIADINDHYQ